MIKFNRLVVKWRRPHHPPPQKNHRFTIFKTEPLLSPLADSAQTQPSRGWLWCVWGVRAGGPIEMGRPVANWPCFSPPRYAVYFLKSLFCSTADLLPDEAPDGWLWYGWFLDRDGRSNLSRPSRLGQGIKSPRRPNIAHNMHPITRFRRSITRPKRTAPLYPDVAATAVLFYCTYSLLRRHGRMMMGCTLL